MQLEARAEPAGLAELAAETAPTAPTARTSVVWTFGSQTKYFIKTDAEPGNGINSTSGQYNTRHKR